MSVDAGTLAVSLAATLGPVGGGLGFLWLRVERRLAVMEAKLRLCQERDMRSRMRAARKLTLIEILWTETSRLWALVQEHDGDDPVQPNAALTRGGRILEELNRPLDPDDELERMAVQLDIANLGGIK